MNSNNFPIYPSITNEPANYSEWCRILLEGENPSVPLYASEGNLTVHELEKTIANLQGKDDCLISTSGRFAIAQSVYSLLVAGDHILIPKEAYRSTRFFCENRLPQAGISVSLYDMCDIESLHNQIQPGRTKAILLEVPSNPMTRIPDFEPFFELKEELGIMLFLDASLAGFENFKNYDFDLIFHSVSKFGTGVGDVMAGATVGGFERIKQVRKRTRSCCDIIDPTVASTILKGLKTYKTRFRIQSENAMQVAKALEDSNLFKNTYYPSLPSHPDYHSAKKQMTHFGQIISTEVSIPQDRLESFFDSLKVFHLSFGAGFTHSLIAPTKLFYMRGLSSEGNGPSRANELTLRLSIGLENPQTLINDLLASAM